MTTIRKAFRRLRKDDGQGMTEYIIIVALIAIAAIGVVTVFGQDIRHLFGASTKALTGDSVTSTGAKEARVQRKTLKNFGKQTQQGD